MTQFWFINIFISLDILPQRRTNKNMLPDLLQQGTWNYFHAENKLLRQNCGRSPGYLCHSIKKSPLRIKLRLRKAELKDAERHF